MNKILILGDGLMGSYIKDKTNWDILSRKKDKIDFNTLTQTNYQQLKKYKQIINCIANTDTYSEDKESHWNVNYKGVVDLVDFCLDHNIKLIHFSTDYIYSNSNNFASEEDIPVHCKTWYGYTKLLGDAYVQLKLKDYLLIRTTHKSKPFLHDFAYTNQIGNFDYIDIIGNICIDLINKNICGLINVGTETKSMYDLAIKTKNNVKKTTKLFNKNTPKNTTMNLKKLKLIQDVNK